MSATVIVSGANGYIAQHVVKQLIENNYKVVGTVRSASKGDQLKKDVNSANFSYEVVEEIGAEGAFDQVLKNHQDATVFLHTASPVDFAPNEFEKKTLLPAINGTKNVLSAIKAHGPQIERLVITSSVAAVIDVNAKGLTTYDETAWNTISWEQSLTDSRHAYFGSKTFAERAAWDFVKSEKPNFVLSTVNPVFVLGPQAYDLSVKETLNITAEAINALLKLKPDSEIPSTAAKFIDVRDIARAHLLAFQKENTKNERLIVSNGSFTSQTGLNVIREHFPQLRDKLPVGNKDDEGTDKILYDFNNEKTKKILGFEFIDFKTTTIDAVKQIQKVRGF